MRRTNRSAIYASGIALVVVASIAGGWLFSSSLVNPEYAESTSPQIPQLVDETFNQAIALMVEKQYSQAVDSWRKLLLLNEDMPEAHVNLGFSLYELGQYDSARIHFQRAMDINPYQANAYYGLAIGLEQAGDLGGALGAMRSFIHLADDSDPYLRKARSAVWEWETRLQTQRSKAAVSSDQPADQQKTEAGL